MVVKWYSRYIEKEEDILYFFVLVKYVINIIICILLVYKKSYYGPGSL